MPLQPYVGYFYTFMDVVSLVRTIPGAPVVESSPNSFNMVNRLGERHSYTPPGSVFGFFFLGHAHMCCAATAQGTERHSSGQKSCKSKEILSHCILTTYIMYISNSATDRSKETLQTRVSISHSNTPCCSCD